jgi:Uma2 family endonuclease
MLVCMEAQRLSSIEDLLNHPGAERIELLEGAIVQRPMGRFEHGQAQTALIGQSFPLVMQRSPDGWWIVPEISVRYSEHHCPSHDLGGWRKQRLPERPAGIMTVLPDWVCEILSPGHERKDTLTHFLRLQRAKVPYYWIVDPEDRALMAYGLDDGRYQTLFTALGPEETTSIVRVPPFEALELNLGLLFGDML